MTEPLPTQRCDEGSASGVITVTLEQADRPVVVLDLPLIQRLEATLRNIPHDAAGLVLASASTRSFVAGADLKTIREDDDETLAKYLEYAASVFGMLLAFPFPTAAAINGAALGGGLELAMHCDALIGAPAAKPYPVGLPEAGLGLCPGWGGTNLLPARMDPKRAIELTARGVPMKFDEATDLFDKIVEPEALLEASRTWVAERRLQGATERNNTPSRWIGNNAGDVIEALDQADLPDTHAAKAVRTCIDAGLSGGWTNAIATERAELVKLRHTDEAKAAIDAFFSRSK